MSVPDSDIHGLRDGEEEEVEEIEGPEMLDENGMSSFCCQAGRVMLMAHR